MIKDYLLEEHRELTNKFNDGIDFEFYELGSNIKDSLYYSHILDKNNFWYITKQVLTEDIYHTFLNVRRDYIKQTFNIYEDEFMDLLKNNQIERLPNPILLEYRFKNHAIVEYLAEEYIVYAGKVYRLTTYFNGNEKICLDVARLS